MFSSRHFKPPAVKLYLDELLPVFDNFIATHRDKWFTSAEVDSARKLRDFIVTDLIGKEHLDNEQLIWRMFSYIELSKNNRVGKLGANLDLCMAIASNICSKSNLKITQSELEAAYKKEWQMIEAGDKGCYLAINRNEPIISALLSVIREKLEQPAISARKIENWSAKYLESLLTSIEDYQKAAETHWFTREGIDRAEQLKILIVERWVRIECLNDYQLLSRMLECVQMPRGRTQGPLGTSQNLRSTIMDGMCAFLELDVDAIHREILQATLPTMTPWPMNKSNFGPAVYLPDVYNIAYDIKLAHITNELNRKLRPENVLHRADESQDRSHFYIM